VLEERSATGDPVFLPNLADEPVIEQLLTPRMALTIAEHLAFRIGRHMLGVTADMTGVHVAL
jgi:V/A-type H+/Na+-transporting ATPase subunit B